MSVHKPVRHREKRMPVTMDAVIGEYLASLKLRVLSPTTIVTYEKVLSHFRDFIRRDSGQVHCPA